MKLGTSQDTKYDKVENHGLSPNADLPLLKLAYAHAGRHMEKNEVATFGSSHKLTVER